MKIITKEYLRDNPNHIFVFGDNLKRTGYGGAASLRDCYNTYGFITKRYPNNADEAYYNLTDYPQIYHAEITALIKEISLHPENTYMISRLGAGLANKHHIWEFIIEPTIKTLLKGYDNVEFLW